MDQNNRNFKVFEIDEEEPDFSAAEKENLLSFDAAISEELENDGWLQSQEKQEEAAEEITGDLSENIPVSEEEMNAENKISEPDKPVDGSQAVPDIKPEQPVVPAVTNISDISDKLAFIMGLIPQPVNESESELKSEPEAKPEVKIEPESEFGTEPGPEVELEPEPKLKRETETEPEPEPIVESGPIDDDFYRYFGDFKFTENGIPENIAFLPEEKPNDDVKGSEQEAETLQIKGDRKKSKSVLGSIFSWVLTIVIAFVVAMSINIYLFRPSEVSGPSMMPTLQDGDTVVLSRVPYIIGKPQRGDIVVIDSDVTRKRNTLTLFSEALEYNVITKLIGHSEPDYFWIKRVVGVEGDTISFEANRFYRNGEELHETYINEQDVYTYRNGYSYTVEKGYVFVMGDNRNHSTDSRIIGPVPIDNIIGKMIAKW